MTSTPTAEHVAALVSDALALSGPLSPVDEGGEHLSWLFGEHHVVRMAPDPEAGERQRRELALRDLLRGRLGIPLPRSAASGEWAPGLAFTVDERLPGASAEVRPVGASGERELAAMLAALRSTEVPAELGLPTSPRRDVPELVRTAQAAADRLAANGQVQGRFTPDAAAVGPAPEVALLHADLKGEHLLVDEHGSVSGVLDWTDAEFGDPATDIAGLAISVGSAAAVRIAERAGYSADTNARGLVFARCDTLIRLDDRLHGADDSPERLLRAQLRRAWEPVPGDRA
ncbi:aminoglycoside 3'-phosphotransferase/choline kinase family protein [Saccharopolyspora sp. WRP15-2]|uniref:Aminoglycoside 3'-phosphotransferase/choline kinase family protein n=1 Tax=Saccharopolyspora oryzae TaxID=2997343 RepID=A0ABT4UZZ8_9PSEU|nr:aminoglycoside 3'-phosphotransferase/choline kinase family protein [Saccharopolyspora oryzae]MDA3627289.1 aminoglycoside 3'-phosphotransferase/choline kinase family protein [Saccharopolyspora oryzae]